MPSKKKKYNARFPPARIKKIMQTDEEIGKVAAAVPVIISRALELFLESLLTKACQVTQSRNAKTMTTSHLKQCIELEQQFDFLKDLVAAVPDMQGEGEEQQENHHVPTRGRKPGSVRKNGGSSSKGKDKKLSGTESEQEEDSEDTETEEEEDGSQSSTHTHTQPPRFNSPGLPSHPSYLPQGSAPPLSLPLGSFAPHPSFAGSAIPPPAPPPSNDQAPLHPAPPPINDQDDDDEDYDS